MFVYVCIVCMMSARDMCCETVAFASVCKSVFYASLVRICVCLLCFSMSVCITCILCNFVSAWCNLSVF